MQKLPKKSYKLQKLLTKGTFRIYFLMLDLSRTSAAF